VNPESRIGTELAGFRIDRVIGRGGMGVVYGAEQIRYGRTVALKVLAPELTHDRQFRERFEQEWRTAARVEHPSIVPIYEAGEADDGLYIAMRYIDGTDLKALLERTGPLAPERALVILGQIADALDTVHANGLVHRDVKPANIFVASGAGHEHAYLGDFGVAKRVQTESGLTQTGVFIGTVDYAAPEQLEGKEVDGRADVYALGCVLYQCLAGARPFEKGSDAAKVSAHLHEPPPSLHVERPDLPGELDAVIARALAKAREDRYPTCGELVRAAGDAVRARRPADGTVGGTDRPITHGSPTLPAGPASATQPLGAEVTATRQAERAPGPRGAGRWLRSLPGIVAMAGTVIAIGVVLGILLTRGGADAGVAPSLPPVAEPPTSAEEEPPPAATTGPPVVTSPEESALQIGDVVSPGEPSSAAGEIGAPGELDVYTFGAAGGEQIFIDNQPLEGVCPGRLELSWKLEHRESSTVVFDETMFDCSEPFDEDGYTLEQGTYVLTVYGVGDATGTYGFLLAPVTVGEFALEVGDVVSPGEPSDGAGEIASPAELDVYTFAGTEGQTVFFDNQERGGECPGVDMGWKLVHRESGTEIFDETMFDCAEPFHEDGYTLEDGTYALTVYGAGGATGAYRFQLTSP
jgi:serine/threonine-protein kinase